MTDTTSAGQQADTDPLDPAGADRRTPQQSDPDPKTALAAGLAALVLAPLSVWVLNAGVGEFLVPLLGLAAAFVASRYAGTIDYTPDGDRTMAMARLGGRLGLAAIVVWVVGLAVVWGIDNSEQISRLGDLFFNLDIMRQVVGDLFTEGLRITLIIWVICLLVGTPLGLVLALMAINGRRLIRFPALVYIDIFRGLPAIVTISLIGIGVPLAGLRPFGRNPILYGGFALGLIATAYIAEIFRAGIQSIDEGQMEASRSLGMSYPKAMRVVIIPQGIRRVVPPLTNEAIALLKDTSLVFVIGSVANATGFFEGRDLFRVGQNVAQQFGNYSGMTAAALFYLVLTIPLTRFTNYLDNRFREGRAQLDDEGDDLAPIEVNL